MVNVNHIIESHIQDECKCRQRKPSFGDDQVKRMSTVTLDVMNIQEPIRENKEREAEKEKELQQTQASASTDYIGEFLGPIGKWQIRTIFLIYLVKIPSSWFMACILYTAPTPHHGEIFCKPPVRNVSEVDQWIKIAHPVKEQKNGHIIRDICHVYEGAMDRAHKYYNASHHTFEETSGKVIPCQSFEERPSSLSIVTQYDLYCSREILVAVTQFCHLFGVLCGGILTTYMMKVIEPRRCMLIGMIAQIVCGNLTGWATMFELHIFFRCLSAVCCGLMYTAGGLIFADITGGKYKVIAICMFEQFWSVGLMLLPAVASYWTNWAFIYMAISFPTVLLFPLYPLIPNSPRWMIQRGRIEEAKEILLEAARVNGKTDFSVKNLEKQLQIQAAACLNAPTEPNYWEMWRGQVKNLVFVHLTWSVYIVIYYGFLLNIKNFGREWVEENTIVCGVCEIIGTFIGLFLIFNARKKWLISGIFNVICSLISLSCHFIPHDISKRYRMILLMVTSMASKISISTTLSILMTCTTEIVSPEKRRLCGYTSTIWTRIWLLSAPFVGATSILGQLVPQTFMSCLNIVGSIFTMFIDTPRTIQKSTDEKKGIDNKAYISEISVPEVWLSSYKQYNDN